MMGHSTAVHPTTTISPPEQQTRQPEPEPATDGRTRGWFGTHFRLAVLVLVLAAAIRMIGLGAESFWYDELIMLRVVTDGWETVQYEIGVLGRPPLYVVLSYGWTQLVGTSELALRALSALLGVINIALLLRFGRKLLGREVALYAAALMAVSTFQVYYAQEFRYYSLVMLFAILTLQFYVQSLERGDWRSFGLFVAAAVGLYYAHSLSILLLAAPGLHFLLYWTRHKRLTGRWLASQVLIVVLTLGLFNQALLRMSGDDTETDQPANGIIQTPFTWLEPPGPFTPVRTTLKFAGLVPSYTNVRNSPTVHFIAGAAVFAVAAAYGFTAASRRHPLWRQPVAILKHTVRRATNRIRHDSILVLLLLWLVCPVLLLFTLSYVFTPMYEERYIIGAAIPLYLLVGWLIVILRRLVPPVLTFAIIIGMMGYVLALYYTEPVKEQWRETAAYVEANVTSADAVVTAYRGNVEFDDRNVATGFDWYYPNVLSSCAVNVAQDYSGTIEELAGCAEGAERVWLVVRGTDQDRERLRQNLNSARSDRLELVTEQEFVGMSAFLFTQAPS